MRNSRKVKAFTLIELIVVIAIIGVLAAILVPSMIGYVSQSKYSTANSNAKLAFTNAATYCTNCEVAGYQVTNASCGDLNTNKFDLTPSAESYVKDGKSMKDALRYLMGGNSNAGLVMVNINDKKGMPEATRWAKGESDKYIGGYPQEASDEHELAWDFTTGVKSGS